MQSPAVSHGFTLVELLIALAVLSTVALGLSTTLVTTHRALRASGNWMRATHLAAEGLEQLRAGQAPGDAQLPQGFERSAVVAPWGDHRGLSRLEVTVSWDDGQTHRVQLSTLARR